MKKRKTRQIFTSFILATAIIFTVLFSGYTTIKSEAASYISKSTFRSYKSISINRQTRVTHSRGYGKVKYTAKKSGYYTFHFSDARVGTSPNVIGQMNITIYRYKGNYLYPIQWSNGYSTVAISTPARRRRYGGYLSYNLSFRMNKGQSVVISTTFLTNRMCNYNIKVTRK